MVGSPVAPDAYEFYDGAAGYDGVELYQSPPTNLPVDQDFTFKNSFWEDFTSVDGFEIRLLLTPNSDAFPTIGIVISGEKFAFSENPSPGLIQGKEDYSVVKQLSNGGFYVKSRDVVETFSGQIILSRASWLRFSSTIKKVIKSSPIAWYVMDLGEDNEEFLTYARLATPPAGSRLSPDLVSASISLIEMV